MNEQANVAVMKEKLLRELFAHRNPKGTNKAWKSIQTILVLICKRIYNLLTKTGIDLSPVFH
jgi:hypothetical protein